MEQRKNPSEANMEEIFHRGLITLLYEDDMNMEANVTVVSTTHKVLKLIKRMWVEIYGFRMV